MPNRRADGTVVRSYTVSAVLYAAVQEKARADGVSVTDVIREALLRYVGE